MEKTKKGDWVTNIPTKGIRSQYPRRLAKYIEGEPKETKHTYPLQKLKDLGLKGLYLNEDIPKGIKSRPLVTFGDKPIK